MKPENEDMPAVYVDFCRRRWLGETWGQTDVRWCALQSPLANHEESKGVNAAMLEGVNRASEGCAFRRHEQLAEGGCAPAADAVEMECALGASPALVLAYDARPSICGALRQRQYYAATYAAVTYGDSFLAGVAEAAPWSCEKTVAAAYTAARLFWLAHPCVVDVLFAATVPWLPRDPVFMLFYVKYLFETVPSHVKRVRISAGILRWLLKSIGPINLPRDDLVIILTCCRQGDPDRTVYIYASDIELDDIEWYRFTAARGELDLARIKKAIDVIQDRGGIVIY
jgi:hypothetical protein